MGWTVGDYQDQVEMMTGHKGLGDKVQSWLNRTIMEISTKAIWKRMVITQSIAPDAEPSTTVSANWISNVTMTSSNPMAIFGANYRTATNVLEKALIQNSPLDFYAYQHGLSITYGTGDVERYCQPKWTSYSNAGSYYMLPQVAIWPQALTTGDADLELKYQSAPEKFTTTTDNNWITNKYPRVVLNGVLRYAYLYLGDTVSYNLSKSQYVNGVADMLRNEETVLASAPYRKGVMPSEVMRGGL